MSMCTTTDIEKYNYTITSSSLTNIMSSDLLINTYNNINNLNIYNYKEEKDNKVTYGYDVPGIRIECKEIWNNKNKKLSLKFSGSAKILGNEKAFTKTIPVDTDVYDKYDWYVKDGILYVTLFEKINERPNFSRVEKTKKDKTKSTKEENDVERD